MNPNHPVHPVLISPAPFRRTLLAWFRRHKRDLPWRRRVTPYNTWISEIMLQQTTVATVSKRFAEWIRRWPDVATLARAREAELLRAWEGLGYYARARNLGRAAKIMVARHGGGIPDDPAALRALPGIGEYTAAAVLSIAFGRAVPLIDANVKRVMKRLLGLKRFSAVEERLVRAQLEELISRRNPGAFNEAMMELGALVCLPANPKCSHCPVEAFCVAKKTEQFETQATRPKITPRKTTIAVVLCGDQILLRQRRAGEINAGMWSFPIIEDDGAVAFSCHDPRRRGPSGPTTRTILLTEHVHTYTRYRERLIPTLIRLSPPRPTARPDERWVPLSKLDRHPMPSVYRRILAEALTEISR